VLKNTARTYGWPAITLHWVMAVVILGLFGLGVWMRSLSYYDTWYHRAPDLHQTIGMVALALLLFRLFWVSINVKPHTLGTPWERIGGVIAHRLFYVLMLIIMASGYLIPTAEAEGFDMFGGMHVSALFSLTPQQADINGAIHKYSAWAIIVLAVLHMAAAFKHHLINRDATLFRMLGIKKGEYS